MRNTFALACLLLLFSQTGVSRPVPQAALKDRLLRGDCEIYGIVHWGLNTYTDREWGFGDENPALLDPKSFDADQIVGACKAGGLQGLVVVAKHHDGFCLWPTKTTEHNIGKSPFRGGKGDYVREMADACRRAGMKFGVYVSPWDRNNADYGMPKYVEAYHAQIGELLGGDYGEIFEVWFDGANGGDGYYGGARTSRRIPAGYYRLEEVFSFIRRAQPKACIFAGMSDDAELRWPGNERGVLDPDSRATTVSVGGFADGKYGNPDYKKFINTGCPDGGFFRMCEADFPLRPGWFFHEGENGRTKSPICLLQRYLVSVGNGGTMNIGIAPDRRGLVSDEDVRALKGFSALREKFYGHPVSTGLCNVVVLREDVSHGEFVDEWELRDVSEGSECVLSGRSIGVKRIRILPRKRRVEDLRIVVRSGTGRMPELLPITYYLTDEELIRKIETTVSDVEETDTAKWMTAGQEPQVRHSKEVQGALGPYVERGEIAGVISVLSDKDYNETWDLFGYADVEGERPMTPNTMFAVFSMSKTFLGAAMMCAIDDGVISLDDRVSKFLPEYADLRFADGRSPKRELTIRDLTCHADGLRREISMMNNMVTLRETARRYAAQPLAAEPGETFKYGTTRFAVAGACLEVATGKRYEDFLEERVLKPLGMKDTTFNPRADQASRMVKAYTTKGGRFRPANDECCPQIAFPKNGRLEPSPGGGLFSTAADMIRFSQMLAHHGEYKGKMVIERKTFDEIFSVIQVASGIPQPYTCGAWLYGDWFGHEGAMRTDQRANLKTGESRVFFIQTENAAGKAFFDAKTAWHKACDVYQREEIPFTDELVKSHENDVDRTKSYQK